MRIAYALLAQAAEFTPDGRLYCMSGDLESLNVQSVPVMLPMLVVLAKFIVDAPESGRPHLIRLAAFGPDNTRLPIGMETPLVPPAANAESKVGICINIANVELPAAGQYIFRLEMDNIEVARLPLFIRVALGPPSQQQIQGRLS